MTSYLEGRKLQKPCFYGLHFSAIAAAYCFFQRRCLCSTVGTACTFLSEGW